MHGNHKGELGEGEKDHIEKRLERICCSLKDDIPFLKTFTCVPANKDLAFS